LHEPVVAHGPFVMNTRAQIVEAFSDYNAGFFGPILSSRQ
jgi:quercetin 2,3-dioxygenase